MVMVLGLSTVYYANSLPKFRLNATTREITAEMRKARALAKIQNETKMVIFNLDKKTFGINEGKLHEIPEGIAIRIVHPATGETRSGLFSIAFHPMGGSEGYSILLSNDKMTQVIKLDPVIGAAVVQ